MEFETSGQQACYEKIAPWMEELFGDSLIPYEMEPVFSINLGSAIAYTKVAPWDFDDAIIITRSFVVTDITINSDLMYYLLHLNESLLFGAFGLDSDDDIIFEHNLIGSTCEKEELRMSVMSVVRIADEYDDEIVENWGGQRALDRMLLKMMGTEEA
ncbi:MAG: YbjN domain-containing protein [Leptolyngbyaceae cyanobacterium bins.59]|nr:YbjN domain-containing protein [Leptolyngbyaceae cyanobacterium bins.59]